MKFAVAITAMALTLSAHAQMRGMRAPMGGRGGFGAVRTMRAPVPRSFPAPGIVSGPLAGHRNVIIVTRGPFGRPFFRRDFFFRRRFFRSPFCFQNPFFCRELFFRQSFIGGFGTFGGFPVGGFPVFPAAPLVIDRAAADATAVQQGTAAQQQDQALAEAERELQDERQRSQEPEQQVRDLRTPQSSKLPPQKQTTADSPPPSTILVLRNGTRMEIQNYAVVGSTLYVFTPPRRKKILISDLDVPATVKANEERGVEFRLPRTARPVSHQ